MIKRYAVINNTIVENIIIIDTEMEYRLEPGKLLVDVDGLNVTLGSTYNGSVFTPPIPETPKQPTIYHTWNGTAWILTAPNLDAYKTELADFEAKFNALLKAFSLVVLDEINIVRTNAALGLAARTTAQLKTAIKAKLPDPI